MLRDMVCKHGSSWSHFPFGAYYVFCQSTLSSIFVFKQFQNLYLPVQWGNGWQQGTCSPFFWLTFMQATKGLIKPLHHPHLLLHLVHRMQLQRIYLLWRIPQGIISCYLTIRLISVLFLFQSRPPSVAHSYDLPKLYRTEDYFPMNYVGTKYPNH